MTLVNCYLIFMQTYLPISVYLPFSFKLIKFSLNKFFQNSASYTKKSHWDLFSAEEISPYKTTTVLSID